MKDLEDLYVENVIYPHIAKNKKLQISEKISTLKQRLKDIFHLLNLIHNEISSNLKEFIQVIINQMKEVFQAFDSSFEIEPTFFSSEDLSIKIQRVTNLFYSAYLNLENIKNYYDDEGDYEGAQYYEKIQNKLLIPMSSYNNHLGNRKKL